MIYLAPTAPHVLSRNTCQSIFVITLHQIYVGKNIIFCRIAVCLTLNDKIDRQIYRFLIFIYFINTCPPYLLRREPSPSTSETLIEKKNALRSVYLNDNHSHIIISTVAKLLYYNELINQAQQIRNKNPNNYVKIMKGNSSKYKLGL